MSLLGSALYNPLWTTSIKTPYDAAVALVGFILLTTWRVPPLIVVTVGALAGFGFADPPLR